MGESSRWRDRRRKEQEVRRAATMLCKKNNKKHLSPPFVIPAWGGGVSFGGRRCSPELIGRAVMNAADQVTSSACAGAQNAEIGREEKKRARVEGGGSPPPFRLASINRSSSESELCAASPSVCTRRVDFRAAAARSPVTHSVGTRPCFLFAGFPP